MRKFIKALILLALMLAVSAQGEGYTWLIEPSIKADDIQPVDIRYSSDERASSHSQENMAIWRNGKVGLIGYNGGILIKPEFDLIWTKTDGMYYVSQMRGEYYSDWSYWSYDRVNLKRCDSPNMYASVYGLHAYTNGKLYYVLTGEMEEVRSEDMTNGMTVIAYERIDWFSEWDWYEVAGKKGIADYNGFIVEPEYDIIKIALSDANRRIPVIYAARKNDKWGYVSSDGKWIAPVECKASWAATSFYTEDFTNYRNYAFNVSDGYIAVNTSRGAGYYDTKGNIAVPLEFEEARPVYEGKAWVKQNGLWGVVQLPDA